MFKIKAADLRMALAEISAAEKNGFKFCEAVFNPIEADGHWVSLSYSDMIEKAHPTDRNLDWGRFQGVTRRNKFKNGKIVPVTPPPDGEREGR